MALFDLYWGIFVCYVSLWNYGQYWHQIDQIFENYNS